MPAEAYEIAALALRYWFVVLGVLIVWRSFSWLKKDRAFRKTRLKQLPDAGMVGELVVISGSEELPAGAIVPMPREGTIGSARVCDVYLPAPGIASRQGDFRFKNGLGLIIMPARKRKIHIDGKDYTHKDEDALMHHGSKMIIGQVVMRLRLFVGLETSKSNEEQLMPPQELETYVQSYYEENPADERVPLEEEWIFSTKPYKRTLREWEEEPQPDLEKIDALLLQQTFLHEDVEENEFDYPASDTLDSGFEVRDELYPQTLDRETVIPTLPDKPKRKFWSRKKK